MSRREFPSSVRMAAKARCEANGWLCEDCGLPIIGRPDYDHKRPDGLGGDNTLENCQVICSKCHKIKTHERDRPVMAKADRQMKAAKGLKSTRGGFQTNRDSSIKMTILHGPVDRRTGEPIGRKRG